jgi:hypothetical protein
MVVRLPPILRSGTFPAYMDSGTISWLAAVGYVLLLAATVIVYTWIFSFVARRRDARRMAEVHEVPLAPEIRKVA